MSHDPLDSIMCGRVRENSTMYYGRDAEYYYKERVSMKKVTYRVVCEHIGGNLHYGEDYLELIPSKEFETLQEAASECIRLRDLLVEKATSEYQKIAIRRNSEDTWEARASVEWGHYGDTDIFRTCMFGYQKYD